MYTVDRQLLEYHVAFEIDHHTTRHPHNYANTMCMCAEPHTHVLPPPSDGVTHSFADAAAAKNNTGGSPQEFRIEAATAAIAARPARR